MKRVFGSEARRVALRQHAHHRLVEVIRPAGPAEPLFVGPPAAVNVSFEPRVEVFLLEAFCHGRRIIKLNFRYQEPCITPRFFVGIAGGSRRRRRGSACNRFFRRPPRGGRRQRIGRNSDGLRLELPG